MRDYAMYSCQDRPVKLAFNRAVTLNGRSSSTHTITLKANNATALRITDSGRSSEHTLRCLGDNFPRMDIKRTDRALDGNLILIPSDKKIGASFVITDTNGVPLWYRLGIGGYQPHLVNRLPDGQLEMLMVRGEEQKSGPQLEATTDAYVLRMDLNGKVYRTVRPYENGKRVAIDNHTFLPVANGYYFIGSRITSSDTPPRSLNMDHPDNSAELQAKMKLCRAAKRWKNIGTRILRTDDKGMVTWSFDIPVVNPVSSANPSWIGEENGVSTCYLDEFHPNWLSLDPTMNRLYLSLRSSGVVIAVDVASKKVLWNLGGSGMPGGLQVSGDPLQFPDGGMHSGSMNRRGEFLVFDNRHLPTDTGRAVIYSIDDDEMTAKFVRAFLPPRDRCTTTGGKVYCPTRVMGNATFTAEGHVLVDWGDKDGNPNMISIFDRNGKLLLDGRDAVGRLLTYKSEYVPSKLANGRSWITSSTVLNATNEKNARTLTG